MTISERMADLEGQARVVDFGGSGSPVVLVHGLGGASENWLALGPRLAAQHAVTSLDLVGFGHTPLAGRPASVDAHVRLLGQYLATLPGPPVTLVGNSMGGLVSLLAAAAFPRRVASVALLCPALPLSPAVALDRRVATVFGLYATPGVGEAFSRYNRRASPEAGVMFFFKLCGLDVDAVDPALLQAHITLAHARRAMPWADRAFLGSTRSVLWTLGQREAFARMARGVRAPVYLLHGGRDRLIPVGLARAAARAMPGWTYTELPDLGHTPMIEAPARTTSLLTAWLRDLQGPAPTPGPDVVKGADHV